MIALNSDPDKIYLVGSYANGKATEDSDIDLLIIKDSKEPRHKRSLEMQTLFIGSKIPVDIVVYTNDEFEKEKTVQYSFISSAIRDAQLMYERKH